MNYDFPLSIHNFIYFLYQGSVSPDLPLSPTIRFCFLVNLCNSMLYKYLMAA